VKLTGGGRLFHGFITRSVKKFAAHHWYIDSLYVCPRVVVVKLYSKGLYLIIFVVKLSVRIELLTDLELDLPVKSDCSRSDYRAS